MSANQPNRFKKARLGVIIGRFQVDQISDGHKDLIMQVRQQHERTLILVGVSPVPGTIENPLDYASREYMLRSIYADLTILPVSDHPSDKLWSENVDKLIRTVFPIGSVCLYGGRDSFMPFYSGQFDTCEFPPTNYIPATEKREAIGNIVPRSYEARRGVIYSTQNQFPRAFVCVDAIIHNGEQAIIAGEKPEDEGKLRLPGGFLNARETPEAAVRREVYEEVGCSVSDPKYVTSRDTHDWRFEGHRDGLVTLCFECQYLMGPIRGGDDLPLANWVDLRKSGTISRFIPGHQALINTFLENR